MSFATLVDTPGMSAETKLSRAAPLRGFPLVPRPGAVPSISWSVVNALQVTLLVGLMSALSLGLCMVFASPF
jgi:hypothetical protein